MLSQHNFRIQNQNLNGSCPWHDVRRNDDFGKYFNDKPESYSSSTLSNNRSSELSGDEMLSL